MSFIRSLKSDVLISIEISCLDEKVTYCGDLDPFHQIKLPYKRVFNHPRRGLSRPTIIPCFQSIGLAKLG